MINLPYEEILILIKEKTNLSEEEINAKVNEKLNQLSGLISKEGAAHIIANELNVQLALKEGESQKIKNIVANMRNLTLVGKVQQKYELREFNSARGPGKVGSFLLGDETGVIRIVLWNDQADKLETFNEGDVLKIGSAYSRDNNGRKEVHVNDMSQIEVNPSGVNIGEVKKREEAPRKKISDLSAEDQNVEILGTIVQVFEIRFFEVDPNTKKRIRASDDNKFYDNMGNEVQPDYSYVSNVFIDDGSSNIRVVCFKNQLERLLNKKEDEILTFRENPQLFESVKHDLLGHIVKIRGRVVNNEMFNRLELVSNLIIRDPNPQDEINKLSESKTETHVIKQETTISNVVENSVENVIDNTEDVLDDSENITEESTSELNSESISNESKSEDVMTDDFFEGNPNQESTENITEESDEIDNNNDESNKKEEVSIDNLDSLDSISSESVEDNSSTSDVSADENDIEENTSEKKESPDDSLNELENMEEELGSLDEDVFDDDEDPLK